MKISPLSVELVGDGVNPIGIMSLVLELVGTELGESNLRRGAGLGGWCRGLALSSCRHVENTLKETARERGS
jgi:hypothetical protein